MPPECIPREALHFLEDIVILHVCVYESLALPAEIRSADGPNPQAIWLLWTAETAASDDFWRRNVAI